MKNSNLKNSDSVLKSEIFREVVKDYSSKDGTFRNVKVDIKKKSREHPNVYYRHMYLNFGDDVLIRKNSETMASVASFLGADHATTNHAVKKFREEYSNKRFTYHKWYMRTSKYLHDETLRIYKSKRIEEELSEMDMKAIPREELDIIAEQKKLIDLLKSEVESLKDRDMSLTTVSLQKDVEIAKLKDQLDKEKMETSYYKKEAKETNIKFKSFFNQFKKSKGIKI